MGSLRYSSVPSKWFRTWTPQASKSPSELMNQCFSFHNTPGILVPPLSSQFVFCPPTRLNLDFVNVREAVASPSLDYDRVTVWHFVLLAKFRV